MKSIASALIIASAAILGGCAHPIVISPDLASIDRKVEKRIEKNVAYYIAPTYRTLEVTTPGGGGDSIKYQPYKELEPGLYKILGNVFKDVTALNSENESDTIKAKSIKYVIKPTINTGSSSPSPFTWPPTKFTVNLIFDISDENGNPVFRKSVLGEGAAEYEEFKADFSLSAKRASQDALLKMQDSLVQSPELFK